MLHSVDGTVLPDGAVVRWPVFSGRTPVTFAAPRIGATQTLASRYQSARKQLRPAKTVPSTEWSIRSPRGKKSATGNPRFAMTPLDRREDETLSELKEVFQALSGVDFSRASVSATFLSWL